MRIGHINYGCLKCGNSVQLTYFPDMAEKTAERFGEMFDAKLCSKCMPVTLRQIKGTAEVLQAWLM